MGCVRDLTITGIMEETALLGVLLPERLGQGTDG
jgi:hypothetical protein